jgi:hypothetical protein
MKLFLGSVSDLPVGKLRMIKVTMNTGGMIAIVLQPRKHFSKNSDADAEGNKISSYLKEAGFQQCSMHKRNMKPVAALCMIGIA